MNGYLLNNNYGLFGRIPLKKASLSKTIAKNISSPIVHFILFGIIFIIVGWLAKNQVLPYSLQSGFAFTFAFSIASIGFCLLMGYSGLASLGTGGFIGIGCYSMYYIMNVASLPFGVALLTAIVVAIVIGVIVGFISLRIEGIYLVILTLALSEILRNLYVVLKDSITVRNIEIFGMAIPRTSSIYVVTTMLVIVMIITHNFINSPTGRAMLAMKNSTPAAQAMGISLMKYRLLAFVICTVYASLSGVMLMIAMRTAMASSATGFYALITSLNILAAVIIGGYRSIWGAVFGTFIMYGLQTVVLNRIQFFAENPVIITLFAGVLVILVVMFYPGGVAQLLQELKVKIKKLYKKVKEGIYGKDLG